jgi:hypothetical protein
MKLFDIEIKKYRDLIGIKTASGQWIDIEFRTLKDALDYFPPYIGKDKNDNCFIRIINLCVIEICIYS